MYELGEVKSKANVSIPASQSFIVLHGSIIYLHILKK